MWDLKCTKIGTIVNKINFENGITIKALENKGNEWVKITQYNGSLETQTM